MQVPDPAKLLRSATRETARILMRPPLTPMRGLRLLLAPKLRDVIGGRPVVVTGASSGIGEATAKRLARAGANVILVARREDELARVAAEIEDAGGEANAVACDLSDLKDIRRLAKEILDRFGTPEVLVNNAGRSIRRPVDEQVDRIHDYQRVMQVNYFGAVQLTLALLPAMLEQGSGRIINIGTWGVAFKTGPLFSAYLPSKTALEAFGRSIDAEVRDRGVTVTTVHPPLTKTPMIAPTDAFRGWPSLRPEEVAEQIAEAIVTRPVRIIPRVAVIGNALDVVAPSLVDRVARTGFGADREDED